VFLLFLSHCLIALTCGQINEVNGVFLGEGHSSSQSGTVDHREGTCFDKKKDGLIFLEQSFFCVTRLEMVELLFSEMASYPVPNSARFSPHSRPEFLSRHRSQKKARGYSCRTASAAN